MRKPFPSLAALACAWFVFAAFAAAPAAAQDRRLQGEFWAEVEPVENGAPKPIDTSLAFRRLVEEAAFVYAGMTWGFSFTYTPPDAARQVEEVYELVAQGGMEAADPRLRVAGRRATGTIYRVYVDYYPSAIDARRLDGWASADFKPAGGSGGAPVNKGVEARREAYGAAIKEAVREYLRPLVKEKPREIRGRLAFAAVPRVVYQKGAYVAIVKLRLKIDAVEPYAVY